MQAEIAAKCWKFQPAISHLPCVALYVIVKVRLFAEQVDQHIFAISPKHDGGMLLNEDCEGCNSGWLGYMSVADTRSPKLDLGWEMVQCRSLDHT